MTKIAKKPRCSSSTVDKDRISALPDCLLHHILSFLDLKHVIATSVLSTSWRHLWKSVPVLDIGNWDFNTNRDIPTLITQSLTLYHHVLTIHKFRAHFDYANGNISDRHIESWIQFATEHKAQAIDLSLLNFQGKTCMLSKKKESYTIPQCLFNCGSLEVMRLACCCTSDMRYSSLGTLKKLELYEVSVSGLDTSGCPLLESLILTGCNPICHFNIYAPNQKLEYLEIKEEFRAVDYDMTLFAPHLLSIQFKGSIRRAYDIKGLSCFRSAALDFSSISGLVPCPEVSSALMNLLECVSRTSTLKLCQGCMQVFSSWEAAGIKLPRFRATCLVLPTNMCNLQAMTFLLRNTDYLESLILDSEILQLKGGHFFYDEAWRLMEQSLSTVRQLKIVELRWCFREFSSLCLVPVHSNIDKLLDNCKEIKLLKALLKSCIMLEQIIISTIGIPVSSPLKSQLFRGFTKTLLGSPRTSLNVEIYFS